MWTSGCAVGRVGRSDAGVQQCGIAAGKGNAVHDASGWVVWRYSGGVLADPTGQSAVYRLARASHVRRVSDRVQ